MKNDKCADLHCDYPLESSPETLRNAVLLAFRVTQKPCIFFPNLGILSIPRNDEMDLHGCFTVLSFVWECPKGGSASAGNIAGKGRNSLRLWRCGSARRPWQKRETVLETDAIGDACCFECLLLLAISRMIDVLI